MGDPVVIPDVELNNGLKMPLFGLGLSHNGGYSHDAVVAALQSGIRLLDTAEHYGNEAMLPKAIKESGVPEGEVFITTKMFPNSYPDPAKAFRASKQKLGKVDLYLLHFPDAGFGNSRANSEARSVAWRELELLQDSGEVRSIGVSNFLPPHLLALIDEGEVSTTPQVNQCEFHPFQHQLATREVCKEYGIAFQGYSPLAKGQVMSSPELQRVAEAMGGGTTPAQVAIRWCLDQGVITIPKSTNPDRVRQNLASLNLRRLDREEAAAIGKLDCDMHVTWDPTGVP